MLKKILSIFSFVLFILGIRYFYLNNPSNGTSPYVICMSKRLTNIDCPGCGGQRAFHQLLHGNFLEAAKLNMFIYFFAPLLTYIFLIFALKPFNINLPDIDISTKGLIVILFIIIIFTILRNIAF